MSIRIGNQSAHSANHILEPFEYAVTQGFGAFEWFPDKKPSGEGWNEDDLGNAARKSIKAVAASHDIRLSVHTPLDWNPLLDDSQKLLQKVIQLAQDIGARLINIHLVRDKGISFFLQAVLPLARILARSGIILSIENTPLTTPEDFNALFAMITAMESPVPANIGMCLDLGHANLCEQTRNNYLHYMDLLEPSVPIVHVHMHENYGDYDAHLPVFTGPSSRDSLGIRGFVERMKNRKFSGTIILEQWPEPRNLLTDARERLLRMWAE